MRRIACWLFALLLSVALAAPAFAAPAQVPLADILSALKIQERPSDYVVIVDTSASMTDQGRYDKVKSALASMLKALRPADRVALVTFDSTAVVRFDGAVGNDPAVALAALPAQPTGQSTDIGTGIDAGLKLLEASGAKDNGAIALVTDGKVDAPGSPYADPASPAWAALKARADALVAKHDIGAYALGLITTTDAALLHQVFAKAVDVPADQFSTRLAALRGELLKFQAAEKLRPDLAKGVTASWSGLDWGHLPAAGGDLTGTLTLTSTYAQIPVEVSDLTVTAKGGAPITVDKLPATVTLAPGAALAVPVVAHVTARDETAVAVTVAGTVASPWGEVLTRDLGLTFKPALTAPAVTGSATIAPAPPKAVDTPAPFPVTQPALIVAGAALLAAVLALLLIARMRAPRLRGSLSVSADGRLVREFLLAGRSMNLKDPSTPGLLGHVTAVQKKGAAPAVTVKAKDGGPTRTVRLTDGQSADFGRFQIQFTEQRTRSLEMISSGLPTTPEAP
jgi:von Willebrand factor type A domain